MASKKDFYEILGVSKNATDAEIKSAYRRLARKHHPDVDKSPGASERFKEISQAYQILSDPGKRKTYDQFGSRAFEPGAGSSPFGGGFNPFGGTQGGPFGGASGGPFGQGGFSYSWSSGGRNAGDFIDPFDLFEQIFGGGFAQEFARGFRRRQSFRMDLTFDEAVKGVTKEVEIERIEGNQGRTKKERMAIKVPAGVDNGTRMRFGDVDIVFRVKSDTYFIRDGADIFTEAKLTVPQIVLGDVIEVRTIDGSVNLKIQAGTEPESLIRIKGRGVARLHGGRGDHYVRVKLEVPKNLSFREKELYQELSGIKQKKKGWF